MRRLILFLALILCLGPVAAGAQDDGVLLLTVSQITFSVVGESEQVYVGTVPAEDVTWESMDESVISVDNGVLTAEGVGSTVVRARYGKQVVECTAGCLAEDEHALALVYMPTLQQPKRIPPKLEMDPVPFFREAVMVGDSITCNLMVHETRTNLLGHPLFLARKNLGVNNFYNYFLNLYYQGLEYHVEDAIAQCGAKKALLLLGMNDIGYQTPEEVAQKYAVVIDRIFEKSPDVELYIQSCLPAYSWDEPRPTHNLHVDQFNEMMVEICAEKGCHFIDLAAYMENHVNGLAAEYCFDQDVHLNYEGSVVWMDVLRAYAYLEGLK